jgi:hypothetical protein
VQRIVLPSVGRGVVTGAAGSTLSASALWPAAVAGSFVEVARGGEIVGRYRIVSVAADGASLTLEVSAAGFVQPGDTYQGVQVFEDIELVGNAHVVTSDAVEGGTIVVDSSSSLEAANLSIPGDTEGHLSPCSGQDSAPEGTR